MVSTDITARDAIATVKRFDGMVTYLVSTNETWQLQGGVTNADWVLISGGGFSVVSVTSPLSGDGTSGNPVTMDLPQYHIYNGDGSGVAQDSGANFLWNETAFTLRVGDLTTSANETQLLLDDSLENFGIINAGSYFLRVNIAAGNYFFGDESNTANGTRLFINDTTQVTRFRGTYNTTPDSDFLNIDFSGGIAQFGDISGSGSGMLVSVDDPSKTVFFGATSLTFWQIDALNENYTGMLGGNASMYIDGSSGTGLENTFLGFASAGGLSTGNRNSVYGALAGGNTADGAENSFFGYSAGNGNSSGTHNTYIGSFAGNVNEGDDNTFIGRRAGLASTAASGMIAIGSDAGLTNEGNGNSIFIGVGADGTSSSVDGGIALGNGALTSKKMMVVGSDTMSMNFFYIGNGIASANPVQSVLFGLTDYIDATTTDGNGSAMILHYGNNTGNGLQGEYQFQGSSYNIGDVSGDLINADITFQRKSGSNYETMDDSIQLPMFIKNMADGAYYVTWHAIASDGASECASWMIVNTVVVAGGIATSITVDNVLDYAFTAGASTWTLETQTDGANGLGMKLAGDATDQVHWKFRWDVTQI